LKHPVGVEKVRDYIFSARNGRGGRVLALTSAKRRLP